MSSQIGFVLPSFCVLLLLRRCRKMCPPGPTLSNSSAGKMLSVALSLSRSLSRMYSTCKCKLQNSSTLVLTPSPSQLKKSSIQQTIEWGVGHGRYGEMHPARPPWPWSIANGCNFVVTQIHHPPMTQWDPRRLGCVGAYTSPAPGYDLLFCPAR